MSVLSSSSGVGQPAGLGLGSLPPPPAPSSSSNARNNPLARKRNHRYKRAEYSGIVVERDYTLGMHVRFVTDYPDELNGYQLSPDEFARTIDAINRIFDEAEGWNWVNICEAFLACTSLYSLWLCWTPHYERKIQQFRQFLNQQNESVYHPKGLHLMDPVLNGLLHFEIIVTSVDL